MAGHYSVTGYKPCEPCPISFYQEANKSKVCERCPESSQSTSSPGSTSADDCIGNGMTLWHILWLLNCE